MYMDCSQTRQAANDAAEDEDRRRYSLIPTVKEEKAALKNYQLPKLAFAVYDEWVNEPFKSGQTPSKYAAVSNKDWSHYLKGRRPEWYKDRLYLCERQFTA